MKLSVKYLILSILLFLFVGAFTQAQDKDSTNVNKQNKYRKFNFGLHISPNINWMKPDVEGEVYKSDGARVLTGFGADFNFFFINNMGIGTGVNVVYTGGKLQYNTQISASDTTKYILSRKYKLQYLEVPFVLIGTTGELMGKFSIYGKFGLGTSFKLNAHADDEFENKSTTDITKKENVNIKSDVSFFRESMIIGLGGTYKVAKIISINFCLTFNNGFTDILRGTNAALPKVEENAKSNYIELSVGILF